MEDDFKILERISNVDDCDMTYHKPDPGITDDECSVEIDACNVTGLWDEYKPELVIECHESDRDARVFKGYFFKNKPCSECNGISAGKTQPGDERDQIALSILISFRTDLDNHNSGKCEPGMVFYQTKVRRYTFIRYCKMFSSTFIKIN